MNTTTSHGSNTNKRTVSELKVNEVILVKSKLEYDTVRKALHDVGFTTNSGSSYLELNNWTLAEGAGLIFDLACGYTTVKPPSYGKHTVRFEELYFPDDEPVSVGATLEDIKTQSEKAIIIFTKVLALQAELSELPLFADIKLTIQTHGTKD